MTIGPQRRPTMYVRPFSEPGKPQGGEGAVPMTFSSEKSWDEFALNPVINGQQMRTLVDPVEHWNKLERFTDLLYSPGLSKTGLRDLKSRESREPAGRGHGSGTYDWVARGDPQREPIEMRIDPHRGRVAQGEGHHRLASFADVQEETGEQKLIKFHASEYGPNDYVGIMSPTAAAEQGIPHVPFSSPRTARAKESTGESISTARPQKINAVLRAQRK